MLLSLGMGLRQSLGLFLTPVTRDLAVTATQFTLAIAIQNIVWGLSQAPVGAIADRFGLRITMMVGAAIYVVGLSVMAAAGGALALFASGALIGVALSCTASSLALTAVVAIPAGLHARAALNYFAPLGNLYLNEIYHASDNKDIQIDFGPQGRYIFGSPSYYNPTFYPFSNWTTSRRGVLAIAVDLQRGRADWIGVLAQMPRRDLGSRWRDFGENLCYLFFGQSWPDNDRGTVVGWLAVWSRWLWLPMVAWTAVAAARHRYGGREWIVPACALISLLLLALQREGIMEGRYRKPIEPIFLAAIALTWRPRASPASRQ